MKKSALLAFLFLLLPQVAKADHPTIYWQGKEMTDQKSEIQVQVKENRIFVPIRPVAEKIGAKIEWNGTDRSITIRDKKSIVKMGLDTVTFENNGQVAQMDVAPYGVDGRTYVPLRFLGEGLGLDVIWDGAHHMVTIGSYLEARGDREENQVKREGYSYLLPKGFEDRIETKMVDGHETFFDKKNMVKEGYGRIGEFSLEKDPTQVPVPFILLGRLEDQYLLFTFSSDVQVVSDDEESIQSFQQSKATVEEMLKTVELKEKAK